MERTPLLLALDTSTPVARVALLAPDGAIVAEGTRAAERHATVLLPLVDQVLRAAGTEAAALAALACGRGPGSFTGLRVGLALAKGLALPFDTPVVLVSSLEALAQDLAAVVDAACVVVPVLDAGKGEVHAQAFLCAPEGPVVPLGPEERGRPADVIALARHVSAGRASCIGGPGVVRHEEAFAGATDAAAGERLVSVEGPSAAAVGRLGLLRRARGERDDLGQAVPAYGRPPDITKPKPRRGAA